MLDPSSIPAKIKWVLSGPGGIVWNPFMDDHLVPEFIKQKWSETFVLSIIDRLWCSEVPGNFFWFVQYQHHGFWMDTGWLKMCWWTAGSMLVERHGNPEPERVRVGMLSGHSDMWLCNSSSYMRFHYFFLCQEGSWWFMNPCITVTVACADSGEKKKQRNLLSILRLANSCMLQQD